MSYAAASRALLAAIEGQGYPVPVAYAGVPYQPQTRQPYLYVTFVPNRPTNESLDVGGLVQIGGFLQVSAFWPKNLGSQDAFRLIEDISADFYRGLHLYDGETGLKVTITGASYPIGPIDDQTRTQVTLMIPWQAASRA